MAMHAAKSNNPGTILCCTLFALGFFFAQMYVNNVNMVSTSQTTLLSKQMPIAHANDTNTNNVTKLTIFSLIGLEGSGHHVFKTIFQRLKQSNLPNTHIILDHMMKYCCRCEVANRTDIEAALDFTDDFCRNKREPCHPLFVTGVQLSIPCGDNGVGLFPNMLHLVDLVENVNGATPKRYDVDLRFIVLRRNIIQCFVSSCIHRFGRCVWRTKTFEQAIFAIDQQVRAMHYRYWIMIDFEDLLSNPLGYTEILSTWMNVNDIELIKYGLLGIEPSIRSNSSVQRSWEKIRQWDKGEVYDSEHHTASKFRPQNNFSLEDTVKEKFYHNDAVNQTVFYDECALVSPQKTAFMQPDVACNL
eukprot:571579_1